MAEASARLWLEPALKVRVGTLMVPCGGPESCGGPCRPRPRLTALTPAAPTDLAARVSPVTPGDPATSAGADAALI